MISPVSSPPRTRPVAWIAATCVLGVLGVALAAATVMFATGGDEPGESPEATASGACTLIEQIPEDGFEMVDGDEPSPHLSRMSAAEALAMLARDEDADYDALYEALRKPRAVASQEFEATGDEFVDALADARDACADEGL